jgi:alkyl sulfatase BDS1-like metallo-beta-lactamase superfamily hydrolase
MCLQCGHEGLADGEACRSCGLQIAEVLNAADAARPDEELLQAAREDFARGTCRRALTLVNHVLRRNARSEEAWSMKGQFFEHLGFRRTLKAAMQEAVRLKGAGAAEPDQVHGNRWWQFWK